MSASPEALDAIRTVARQLGPLREQVVFIGGVTRGLLVTDPAVEGSRATRDVDVIAAGIATRAEYYEKIHEKLRTLGFREDTSEGAPLCRWKLGELIVDVMPPVSDVLGFSNRWYLHAIETATTVSLPGVGDEDSIEIRLVTAPSFLATKLEAFAGRGGGDYAASHDIEDIVAVVDGRPSLVQEVEQEPDVLRSYVATELERHLSGGLLDALGGHLAGDAGSQGRLPIVACSFDRFRRCPRLLSVGEIVIAGAPGATGGGSEWRYEILGVERRRSSAARDHVVVRARLTTLSRMAGTVGDGRDVHIEDARGLRFPPLFKLLGPERQRRGLLDSFAQAVPDEPFETCWVYELPRDARALRVLIPAPTPEKGPIRGSPFDGYEFPLQD